mmetsp:Transcript_34585/g.75600  ORF Transcript_34585/g.75600 Transcript_34585/m.75600 type:complete len:362 (-) Transcript_34585:1103-2188(-)
MSARPASCRQMEVCSSGPISSASLLFPPAVSTFWPPAEMASRLSFSRASTMWRSSTFSSPSRMAVMAASFIRFMMSAPVHPAHPRAMRSQSTSPTIDLFRACTCRIWTRPWMPGSGRCRMRSKRPGRVSASSSTAGRLVAASTTMPVLSSKPSISVSIWLMVLVDSSPPIMPLPERRVRDAPSASNSSMKMMQGAALRAMEKRLRTRDAPTPTNISTNSDPAHEKKGTFASPAIAFASSVLPVPGGPTRSAPFGILPPRSLYFPGFFRKLTNSITSAFASSHPATSLNITLVLAFLSRVPTAALPTEKMPRPPPMPPPPPPMPPPIWRRVNHSHPAKRSRVGARRTTSVCQLISEEYTTGR